MAPAVRVVAALSLTFVMACAREAGPAAETETASTSQVEEANKELVRRYFEEVWSAGNIAQRDSFLSAEYRGHAAGNPEPMNREAWTAWFNGFRAAFPDARFTVEDMVAEGDRVAARLTMRGTHQGPLQGMPATGRSVTVTGISIERITNGRIVEGWSENDALGMLGQLGALPGPGGQ